MIQSSLFDFLPKAQPLVDYGVGSKWSIYRPNAIALVADIGKLPSGKGNYERCMKIDHSRSWNAELERWDARYWFQGSGNNYWKYIACDGSVEDRVNIEPMICIDGKMCKRKQAIVLSAFIEDDGIHLVTDHGEYVGDISDRISHHDANHPYRPDFIMEHMAIEMYRHGFPRDDIEKIHNGPWATQCIPEYSDEGEFIKEICAKMGLRPTSFYVPKEGITGPVDPKLFCSYSELKRRLKNGTTGVCE